MFVANAQHRSRATSGITALGLAVCLTPMLWAGPGAGASSNEIVPTSAVCASMSDAMLKTAKTPYMSMSIITLQPARPEDVGKHSSRTSETIFTGKAVFVRSGGSNWRKIDVDVASLQELVRKASSRLGHCQDLGADTQTGVPVVKFAAEETAKAYGTTTTLWVDKAKGVLVRSETNTKTQDGTRHSDIQYRYENVAPPAL